MGYFNTIHFIIWQHSPTEMVEIFRLSSQTMSCALDPRNGDADSLWCRYLVRQWNCCTKKNCPLIADRGMSYHTEILPTLLFHRSVSTWWVARKIISGNNMVWCRLPHQFRGTVLIPHPCQVDLLLKCGLVASTNRFRQRIRPQIGHCRWGEASESSLQQQANALIGQTISAAERQWAMKPDFSATILMSVCMHGGNTRPDHFICRMDDKGEWYLAPPPRVLVLRMSQRWLPLASKHRCHPYHHGGPAASASLFDPYEWNTSSVFT